MLVVEGFSMSFALTISTHISAHMSGLFHQSISWGIVIISSCLLLIGRCLWLLSENGKKRLAESSQLVQLLLSYEDTDMQKKNETQR